MALTLANKLSLPAMVGRQADWLAGDPLARTAFFRNDFTTGRHVEGGRVVSWPGGWTVQRDSTAYYTTASGALIAAADDVARVAHFDVDEMVRVLLMEKDGGNIFTGGEDFDAWTLNSVTKEADPDRLARTGVPMTKLVGTNSAAGIVAATLSISIPLGVPYVVSVDAATDQHQFLRFHGFGNGQNGVVFDLHNQTYQINTQWDAASIRLVAPGIVRCTAVVRPALNGTVYIGMTDGLAGDDGVPAGTELSLALAMMHPGIVEESWSTNSRDADKVFRSDLAALGANTVAGFWHEVKVAARENGQNFPRLTYSDDGDGTNRNHTLLNNVSGTIGMQQYVAGVSQGAVFLPYVPGTMEHLFARFGDGDVASEDALQLIASGIRVNSANPTSFAPSENFRVAALDEAGSASGKPDSAKIAILGLHPPILTQAEAIDASAPVKTVAQIEGVTPLLDLDFENRAFSMGGKARGLSNILSHVRDSAAYGILSDGREASHPDDFPRLTFEDGVRAHLSEATRANLFGSFYANANASVVSMPDEVGPDGLTGSVYRVRLAAEPSSSVQYQTVSALTASNKMLGAYIKAWGVEGTNDVCLYGSRAGGNTQGPVATATDEWRRITLDAVDNTAVYLNNADDSFATDVLVAFPTVEYGVNVTSVIGTNTTRAADNNEVDLLPIAGDIASNLWVLIDAVPHYQNGEDQFLFRGLAESDELCELLSPSNTSDVLRARQRVGSTTNVRQFDITNGQRLRVAVHFSADNFIMYWPGGVSPTGAGVYEPPTRLLLGYGGGTSNVSKLITRRLVIPPSTFTAAQAQAWIGAMA